MIRRPPISTRTDTLFPYTTLFRSQWLSWLPGGLMHSNIGTCTMFAAVSGSSVATAATIGTVAVGEIERHRYNERLFLGTIAAGGTLGILIPPSIVMIVYGALTETSIPQLYLAGNIRSEERRVGKECVDTSSVWQTRNHTQIKVHQ